MSQFFYLLVAVEFNGNQPMNFRVIEIPNEDIAKCQVKTTKDAYRFVTIPFANLVRFIQAGNTVSGVEVVNDDLVPTNGAFERYRVRNDRKSPLVVVARAYYDGNLFGFIIVDCNGMIALFDEAKTIRYIHAVEVKDADGKIVIPGIANGNVKDEHICANSGEYPRADRINNPADKVASTTPKQAAIVNNAVADASAALNKPGSAPVIPKVPEVKVIYDPNKPEDSAPLSKKGEPLAVPPSGLAWPEGNSLVDEDVYKGKGVKPKSMTVGEKVAITMQRIKAMNYYFYAVLDGLQFMPCHPDNLSIETAGVSAFTRRFYYNCGFIRDLTMDELLFLFIHEAYHIILMHGTRFDAFSKDGASHEMWNIAGDYFINKSITEQFNMPGFTDRTLVAPDASFIENPQFAGVPGTDPDKDYLRYICAPEGGLFNPKTNTKTESTDSIYKELMNAVRNQMQQSGQQGQSGNQQQQNQQQNSQSGQQGQSGQQNGQSGQQGQAGNQQNGSQQSGQTGNQQNGSQQNGQSGNQQNGQAGQQNGQAGQQGGQQGNQNQQSGQNGQSGNQNGQQTGNQGGQSGQQGGQPGNQGGQSGGQAGGHGGQAGGQSGGQSGQQGGPQMIPGGTTQHGYKYPPVMVGNGTGSESGGSGGNDGQADGQSGNGSTNGGRLVNKQPWTVDIINDTGNKKPTPEDMQKAVENNKQTLMDGLEKTRGANRGIDEGIMRQLGELLKPKVDFRQLLRNKLNILVNKDQTYLVANRKGIYFPTGTRQPGYSESIADGISNVVFAIDASGSMSDAEINFAFGYALKLCEQLTVDMDLIFWHGRVEKAFHATGKLDCAHILRTIREKGLSSGGTEPECIFIDWIDNKKAKYSDGKPVKHRPGKPFLICVTDGEFSGSEYVKYKSHVKEAIWIMINKRCYDRFHPKFGLKAPIKPVD